MVNLAGVVLPIRGVQLLLSILNLGLSAYMVHYGYGTSDDTCFSYYGELYCSPGARIRIGEFGYALFASLFAILSLIYLIPAATGKLPGQFAHPIPVAALDALNMLFWFSSWIAVAAWRGRYSLACHVVGSSGCGVPAAFAAFGAVEWLTFLATLAIGIVTFFQGRKSTTTTAPAPTAAPGTAPGPAPVV